MSIGQLKILGYIHNNRLSIEDFAAIMGVSRQTVHRWLRGTVPNLLNMIELKKVVGVEPQDWFAPQKGYRNV